MNNSCSWFLGKFFEMSSALFSLNHIHQVEIAYKEKSMRINNGPLSAVIYYAQNIHILDRQARNRICHSPKQEEQKVDLEYNKITFVVLTLTLDSVFVFFNLFLIVKTSSSLSFKILHILTLMFSFLILFLKFILILKKKKNRFCIFWFWNVNIYDYVIALLRVLCQN